ncbi:MAG: mechanosensitive ion channel family protein [Candidatus Aenigmarchaeota archaeon]|nr:mechanosensitive ion channel family protein [Candidatus Aenigmarchaeota archaeon]
MAIYDMLTPINILQSILVIVSAYIIVKFFERNLIKPMIKRGEKRSVIIPLKRVLSIIVYLIAFFLILSIFSIDITGIATGLGVGAIVLGFGLQDIVSNWVSGIIITAEKIYKIDDVIKIGDTTGVVSDISLRSTKLTTYDKNDIIIPNSLIIKEKVINLTGGSSESVSAITFMIDYTSDTDKAKKVMEKVLRSDKNVVFDVKRKREIRFIVRSNEWTTEIECLFWINEPKNEEFIKSRLTQAIKKEFEKENIIPTIPSFLRKGYIHAKKMQKRKR